ncbi:AMP-binding protein [Sphingomonas oligoaromativorans]|jgi:acyl-CoA synthetase (AMP-forming)/AMP-acid ligase II|uniref:AMP-binding protein n=1 Tax=Sphingomonas oligoaromativorans TaxID=575322 RepID=UPI001420E1DF|nr:AMP-binding protein [Sphingomonas oligoaromativorans]NIJ33266.1 acyl-CoA synthetase (AMP-forming)/AMP-acid ligase II [Sphingomonas oligoaromativorans]
MTDAPIYTYGRMLRASAAARGEADALVFPDRRSSHAELHEAARAWARAFIAMGIRPGQNVGILLTTRPEFVELLFGIVMAGAVAVPVNARYQAHELAFVVKDADLVTLVTTGKVADQLNFAERLGAAFPALGKADPQALHLDAAPMLRRIICLDPPCQPFMISRDAALAMGEGIADADLDARIDAVDPEDIAFILYTSGTTANPKGALISHRGIIGNSRNLGVRYRVTAEDKVWSPLPIFHIAGILPLTMVLDAGGAYLTVPHFDAGTALAMLGREGATVAYPSFVTIMQDLITHPSFPTTDLSKLRLMNSNFAVQPAWIREAMTRAMPHTVQVGTYGLTEGAGTICTSHIDDSFELRTGRLGVPLAEWEVRIVDIETGRDCAPGERGEIVARGPNMLKGYYNAPEKSAEVLRGGWFHTGDIGSFDESGHIMFHGRTKDMLKVGGENVAAAEIESMLQTHPAVKLAQVVGIPDPRYVEVPAAFVELVAGATASEAELIAHCKGQLASFKIPRHVRFVEEWPMSTSKIQKYRLRARLIAELGLGEAA